MEELDRLIGLKSVGYRLNRRELRRLEELLDQFGL
jgi:hypothetical protein